MKLTRLFSIILFVLAALFQISNCEVTDNQYYKDKITRGIKVCGLYLCTTPIKDYDYFPDSLTVKALGREFDYERECFMPFQDEFAQECVNDKPGDSLVIIFGENRYITLVKNVGLYFDDCDGLIPVCNLVAIDSIPEMGNWWDKFVVLRKTMINNWSSHRFSSRETIDKRTQTVIDSLNREFLKNAPYQESGPPCVDSISVFSDLPEKLFNIQLIAFNCHFNEESDYSALYAMISEKNGNQVYALQSPGRGIHQWEFLSSFDLDGDGNREYLFYEGFYEGGALSIITFKDGKWIRIFDEAFGGC